MIKAKKNEADSKGDAAQSGQRFLQQFDASAGSFAGRHEHPCGQGQATAGLDRRRDDAQLHRTDRASGLADGELVQPPRNRCNRPATAARRMPTAARSGPSWPAAHAAARTRSTPCSAQVKWSSTRRARGTSAPTLGHECRHEAQLSQSRRQHHQRGRHQRECRRRRFGPQHGQDHRHGDSPRTPAWLVEPFLAAFLSDGSCEPFFNSYGLPMRPCIGSPVLQLSLSPTAQGDLK